VVTGATGISGVTELRRTGVEVGAAVAHAEEREHELANENRAANDRAPEEDGIHGLNPVSDERCFPTCLEGIFAVRPRILPRFAPEAYHRIVAVVSGECQMD
jgi:hypothetical protein